MSNGVNMRRGRGRDGGMRGVELGKETLTTETTEVRAFVFRPDEEEVAPKRHWLYQNFHHFYCERFFLVSESQFPCNMENQQEHWKTFRILPSEPRHQISADTAEGRDFKLEVYHDLTDTWVQLLVSTASLEGHFLRGF